MQLSAADGSFACLSSAANVSVQQQITELGLIRQSLYELETVHQKSRESCVSFPSSHNSSKRKLISQI